MRELKERLELLSERGVPRGPAEILRGVEPNLVSLTVPVRRPRRYLIALMALVLVVAIAVAAVLVTESGNERVRLRPGSQQLNPGRTIPDSPPLDRCNQLT